MGCVNLISFIFDSFLLLFSRLQKRLQKHFHGHIVLKKINDLYVPLQNQSLLTIKNYSTNGK